MGERRALLHVMIAEQPEVIALRKTVTSSSSEPSLK